MVKTQGVTDHRGTVRKKRVGSEGEGSEPEGDGYEAKSWQEAQATRCNSCRQLKNRRLGGPPFPLEAYLWAGPYLWAGRLLRPCRIQQRRPRRARRNQPVRQQCPARRTHQASTQRAKHRPGRPTHTPVRQHRLRGRWSWIRTTSGSVLTVDLLQDLLQQLCMKCQHHRIAPQGPTCKTTVHASGLRHCSL